MAVIQAPLSRYKRHNYLILIAIFIACVVIFGYDGYLSKYDWSHRQAFYKEHVTDNGGVPDTDMKFNLYSPPVFLAAAIVLAVRFFMVRDKNLTADESALHIDNRIDIPYTSIESINKTYFDKKGYFILTYKDAQQKEQQVTLSDRTYDNLPTLLDTLISKIS